ncbi:GNAT family N-acetyltransferase [Parerythrobacter jejuensis]|uniref:GNAT family N-acetyltransferase n=1 Tax=Parerythrobacter jejuensis TaxID=795812 RepID=A0A845AWL5_9SPHN|nr:GNAT family N-acetyltransferase [Parerythrobacter jejuensis]MXP31178.1 GNAT family N-acetyltransferase [Parerythrobacter jejuensis]MXP33938.1 GNAT family N-acetyltransferase [Parerythrobacter jejuensis]
MHKTDFKIRPFRPVDLPSLHAVRQAAFAPVFANFRSLMGPDIAPFAYGGAEADQGAHLDSICQSGSDHQIVVAEVEDRVIGFCDYALDARTKLGTIGLNAVDPAFAKRGVGSALYRHVLGLMRAGGMKAAGVGTGGDSSHAPARRAYEKAGFSAEIPSVWLLQAL